MFGCMASFDIVSIGLRFIVGRHVTFWDCTSIVGFDKSTLICG